jgi:hypothetical protein
LRRASRNNDTGLWGSRTKRLWRRFRKSVSRRGFEESQEISQIHTTLLIAGVLALWIFPSLVAVRVESYATGILLQLPILFFNTILHYSIWFSSELTLVPFSIGAVSLCFLLLHQAEQGTQKLLTLASAGAACGLGIVTKLTFFPIILITLACCRSFRSFVVFGVSLFVAAALALIPIYPELPRIYQWVLGLSVHSGRYGSGAVGFATNHYLADAATLLSGEPFVFLIPVLATGTIVLLTIHSGWSRLDLRARK